MNKEVTIGISQVLDEWFGYTVYKDSVKQNMKTPCFLLERVQGGVKHELGRRYKSSHYYDIKYFTDTEEPAMEYLDVEERLYECLEWIPVGNGCTKALEMKGSVIDGVLHFFVTYGFHVLKQTMPEEPMNYISIQTKLGGEEK